MDEKSWGAAYELEDVRALESDSFVDGPFGFNLKAVEYTDRGVRLIQLQNIGDGYWIDSHQRFITPRKFATLSRHGVRPGDIAIAKMAEPVARACIVPPVSEWFVVVADCIKLRPDPARFDPVFVAYAINSHETRQEAVRKSAGTTRLRINLGTLKTVRIWAPSLDEQQAIASALKAVDNAIESTEFLVAKLRLLNEGLVNDLLHSSSPRELPRRWGISSVAQEFDVMPGITLGPHRRPRRRPHSYLRVANVHRGRLELDNLAELEITKGELRDRVLREDDLLVVEGHADINEIGRCALVNEEAVGLAHQNHLFRLRSRRFSPHFALLWLNSRFVRDYWRQRAATSSGLNTINQRNLRRMPVAVPSRDEQDAIVDAAATSTHRLRIEEQLLKKLRLLREGLMTDLLEGDAGFRRRVASLIA